MFDTEPTARQSTNVEHSRSPEEVAPDILAVAAKNQAEDGPNTRRAAIRACKYLRAMVMKHSHQLRVVYDIAKTHAQRSKAAGPTGPSAAPTVAPELHRSSCLSTLPDPWPLAKVTINMESCSQWVSKMCRLFYAEEYAKLTDSLHLRFRPKTQPYRRSRLSSPNSNK